LMQILVVALAATQEAPGGQVPLTVQSAVQ
jgi:hypothetical protein